MKSHYNEIIKCKPEVYSICPICGIKFLNKNSNKTCGNKSCIHKLIYLTKKQNNSNMGGGFRKGTSRCKKGIYKGYYCDSSYELAYVIYCLDHNINIIRNKKYFNYIYNNKKHRYYPDFYLPDEDIYIEIKGYYTDLVDIKARSTDKQTKILYLKDISYMFTYIKNTYHVNDITSLYDKKI